VVARRAHATVEASPLVTAHVVIVGGGFGGLYAARRLASRPVRITVVDRQNHHLFQPLLYQVATAGLSPADIASPIRALVEEHPNVKVCMGDVVSVDLPGRRVLLADGELTYDFVIIATGVRHGYFGHDEWEALAPGLKTLDDALEIRRRVLAAFERAERELDAQARDPWLTFVVVGAGPTGVELAGAIAELARFTVAGEFRMFDPAKARVVLVEASPRLLAAFDARLAERALWSLKELGVDVRLGCRVTDICPEGVELDSGFLPARTVLWAAGVSGSPLAQTLGVPLDRAGRVLVEKDLCVPGHPEAYVVGDLASLAGDDGQTLPGLAPVAIQQGEHAADNIAGTVEQRARQPFHYRDKGIMATVGRASGIAQTGRLRLSGFLGWLAWLFIHILYLIGFRNRLLVMIQWAWAWFTFGRGARLITGMPRPPRSRP
jgi:NADH dehydrogenase